MGPGVVPFHIDVPEAEIEDLRDRLRRTRWPEAETVEDSSQGTPLAYVRELCRYWRDDYDWTKAQARLNRFPQFRRAIDGVNVHFVHVRSPHESAVPLVITHGWPGSVVEFGKVIEPLVDPAASGASDTFHVVCPTLPGFGFSGKPARPGWGTRRIADTWDQLMTRLGYSRYGAQGGDWGSQVTTGLAVQQAPDRDPPEHGPGMRRAGSGDWAGLLNCYYWLDRTSRIAVAFLTQVSPFFDQRILETLLAIEQATYAGIATAPATA
jgi:hypothetical protein